MSVTAMSETERIVLTAQEMREWVDLELVTAEQHGRLVEHLRGNGSFVSHTSVWQRLDIATIAYYFGGFIILLAYTIFMGIQWENLGAPAQTMVTVATIAVLGGLGAYLRERELSLAGNLLIFAATGLTPLLIYCVQQLFGLWPDPSVPYQNYYHWVSPLWISMEVISIVVTVFVWYLSRFPLHTLLISFWTWFLSMDFVRWVGDASGRPWSTEEQAISTLIGIALILIGIALQKRAWERDSFWFYLFGHILVLCHLAALTLDQGGWLSLIFIAVYLLFVVGSVWLQRRVFLVFGAIGIYGYVCYFAFTLLGVLGFTFGLALVGLLIIFSAVWYQRYAKDWLESRLASYQIG